MSRFQPLVVPVPARVAAAPASRTIADELAPMVEVWHRLLRAHVPDEAGRCRACTAGGTGVPRAPWPCVIRGVAELARINHTAGAA